jgi:hypothetical protein
MHFGRTLLAFLVGIWLYQAAVVNVGGILAAIAIPRSYFDWFGPGHKASAPAVLKFVGFGLPVAVLVAGGVLAAVRLIGGRRVSVLEFLFVGLLVSLVFTVALTALHVQAIGGEWAPFVFQTLIPPWWALPGAIGPWAGFAFAAWASHRVVTA